MKIKHAVLRLLTQQDSWDSTRLCWCVRTAASAIVSKPHSHCRVFVSLTGLDWTQLELLVCTHPKGGTRQNWTGLHVAKYGGD